MKPTNKMAINILMALVLGFVFLPVAAQASCGKTGPIVRVTNYDDSYSSRACYIYMRSGGPLTSYYNYTRTNDDNICTTASIAATSGVDTTVRADASSCPTSGTARFMGELSYLIINP